MTLSFKKYNSIENHYREKYINEIHKYGYEKEIYVVQEKIDGANFSFITDGKELRVASRNQIVDNTFFNCQTVIDKYKDAVIKLFNFLQDYDVNSILSIQLYGELFGDSIQNRVKYCKHKDFILFDLLINCKNVCYFLSTLDLNCFEFKPLISSFNLFEGNLNECLDYCKNNLNQSSFIAQNYFEDYKDLQNNISEGFVIKPVENLYLSTGDRVIIKYKNPSFLEINPKFKEKKDIELNAKDNEVLNILLSYLTENRLSTVISKIGNITNKDFGKLLGMLAQDIFEEFNKNNEEKINKNVNKKFMNECGKFIRTRFVNLIDN